MTIIRARERSPRQHTKHALRLSLIVAVLAFVFPATVLADLNQTTTLSTSNPTNLNLDTGTTSSSGGDIQFSSSGITPQGNATAVNAFLFATTSKLTSVTELEVSLYPGYAKTEIPSSILQANDMFYVRTNGNNYSVLLVTATVMV